MDSLVISAVDACRGRGDRIRAVPRRANTALVAVVAGCALVQLWPTCQAYLQFDREAIAAGDWWRLLSGNFVHYNWYHWAANVGAFAALGWICGGLTRRVVAAVLVSAIAVGLAVYLCAAGVGEYRGISGIDCALLAMGLVRMARDGGRAAVLSIAGLVLVFAKSAYEALTGQVLLPTSAPPGVAVVGVTHVVGLGAGVLTAMLAGREKSAGPARTTHL